MWKIRDGLEQLSVPFAFDEPGHHEETERRTGGRRIGRRLFEFARIDAEGDDRGLLFGYAAGDHLVARSAVGAHDARRGPLFEPEGEVAEPGAKRLEPLERRMMR